MRIEKIHLKSADPFQETTIDLPSGSNPIDTCELAPETWHSYYADAWQAVEERVGTTPDTADPNRHFIWGVRYIDDLVLRDRSVLSGILNERRYACQDANWNVTAIVDTTGTVQERYEYDPYGTVSFLSATFFPLTASGYGWETLYAGYRYDSGTGSYVVRNRVYVPQIGWLSRDPLGNSQGLNLYEYASSLPTSLFDPFGTEVAGYNHCYPLFLGGSNSQPLIYMSQQAHTAFHDTLQQALGRRFGDEARAAFNRLSTAQQNALLKRALCAAGVPKNIVKHYWKDIIKCALPGTRTTRMWATGLRIGGPKATAAIATKTTSAVAKTAASGVAKTVLKVATAGAIPVVSAFLEMEGTAQACEIPVLLRCTLTVTTYEQRVPTGWRAYLFSPSKPVAISSDTSELLINSTDIGEVTRDAWNETTSEPDDTGYSVSTYTTF